jgi:hypothetical protein
MRRRLSIWEWYAGSHCFEAILTNRFKVDRDKRHDTHIHIQLNRVRFDEGETGQSRNSVALSAPQRANLCEIFVKL